MDLRKLKTIIELFENSLASEMEISEGEDRIRLSKHTATPHSQGGAVHTHIPIHGSGQELPSRAEKVGAPEGEEIPEETGHSVTSPVVGTFFRSSSPETKPFVSVGDVVQKGQTVCIVEAMKLMNEVQSPCDGTVRKILVENATPVGFGDALMLIE